MVQPTAQLADKIALFAPGMAGSDAFRIPSLLTTQKGTVIAGIDVRWKSDRDNPNHITIGIRRSEDHGRTWGELQLLVEYPGEGLDGAAAIDTALLEDKETGTLWMLFSHTPGGIGLWTSQSSVGFDAEGNRLLYDESGHEYALQPDGAVIDGTGSKTEYFVDGKGDVWSGGILCGNIFAKDDAEPRSLLEARTSFLQVIKSEDDGLTWSKPIELNPQVKKPWMRFIGSGPGKGIQLASGERAGRLVFPIYFSNTHGKLSNAVIYSDDHGVTWNMGQSPNEGRQWEGSQLSVETINMPNAQLTESQVVELDNGELAIYMRNHSGRQRTAVATSRDGGETWGEVTFVEALIDPICQSSITKYPDMGDGKIRLLWSNPCDAEKRINGTVKLSEDGGLTWPYSKVVHPGVFWYSCLTVLSTGEIGLLYEGDGTTIYFIIFTLDWLKG